MGSVILLLHAVVNMWMCFLTLPLISLFGTNAWISLFCVQFDSRKACDLEAEKTVM